MLAGAALIIPLFQNLAAADETPFAGPAASGVTTKEASASAIPLPVAPPASAAVTCSFSARTVFGAAMGSILGSAGNTIGSKNKVEGLGTSAGDIAHRAIAPECASKPTDGLKISTPDFAKP